MDETPSIAPLVSYSYLSLAERVVHHAGKLNLQPVDIEETITALQTQAFSWEETIDLAHRQWVLPILAGNFRGIRDLSMRVPPPVDRLLQLAQFGAGARTSAILGAFNPVAKDLTTQGVDFAFMKGAALCQTIYRPGWRLLNDIDVLVRKKAYQVVTSTLVRHGFEPALEHGEAGREAASHQISFVRPWTAQGPLVVDLHWQLPNHLGPEIDTDELLGRVRKPGESLGTGGMVLSAEDTFVQYAMQLVVDFLRINALRLADIHALASRELDWNLLVDVALRSGAGGTTFVALRLAADRGAPVPDFVLKDLPRACPNCRETAELLRDPRWPFGRWDLARTARYVLLYGLHASGNPGASCGNRRRAWAAFRKRLFGALRRQRLRFIGTLVGATAWALRLWAARCVSRFGALGIASRLRGTLWRFRKSQRPDEP